MVVPSITNRSTLKTLGELVSTAHNQGIKKSVDAAGQAYYRLEFASDGGLRIAEGVEIHYLAAPVRVLSEAGRMSAVECIRMQLGEPDDSGRRRPVPIAGSEFTVAADSLIPAVSQGADQKMAELFGLETTPWATIDADEVTMLTSSRWRRRGSRPGQRDRCHRAWQTGGRCHRQLPVGATRR